MVGANSGVAVVGTAAIASLASAMGGKAIDHLVVDSVAPATLSDKQIMELEAPDPSYPDYDVVNPDGTVEKAEQGGEKRNAKGYVVEPRRMVAFRESPKKGSPIRYQTIPMCGHKFVPQQEPRHRGCESCWFTFFQVHGELTQAVEKVYQDQGEAFLVKLKGRPFVTNFLKFMSTVAQYKQVAADAQAAQEKNGIISTGGTVRVDEGESNTVPDSTGSDRTLEA